MFVIDLHYIAPLDELDKHMSAHVKYLKKFYEADVFIVSGRKVPRTGGIIIAQADSEDILWKIIEQDPFYKHKLAEFTVTAFNASQMHPALADVIR